MPFTSLPFLVPLRVSGSVYLRSPERETLLRNAPGRCHAVVSSDLRMSLGRNVHMSWFVEGLGFWGVGSRFFGLRVQDICVWGLGYPKTYNPIIPVVSIFFSIIPL